MASGSSEDETLTPVVRRLTLVFLVGYAVLAGILFLWPDGPRLHRINLDLWLWLRAHGLPNDWTPDHVEQFLNVLTFAIPLFLLPLAFPKIRWFIWVGGGVLVSGLIETAQAMLLASRHVDALDFAANSFGALIGVALAKAIFWRTRREEPQLRRNR